MEPPTGQRRNSRIQTHFETSYSSGRQDGSGILANISYSGALLTNTSVQPRLGSQVRVYVLLSENSPFVIVGQVVRHLEDGFAIEYADLSPELYRLVDEAAAMVGKPGYVAPGMDSSADQRRSSRIQTHFETTYSSSVRQDGSGILANISYSGALLTHTSVQPRLGSQVRVHVLLSEDSSFEVVGQVVRHVKYGFAIEYADLSPELRRLVEDAAEMLGNPRYVPPRRQQSQS